ncbi:unnamed protein product [Porites lobata]|uniref:Uncharacterized protein n=1 Tax=Porites lobata TaxID=104759 RepID=A0ABN8R0E3_9CNID|nr:unnamed protein product [Porites lobata]
MASRFEDVTDSDVAALKDATENMNTLLERFYASVRKQDGTDYEPGSLKVMQAALDRHLKEKGTLCQL